MFRATAPLRLKTPHPPTPPPAAASRPPEATPDGPRPRRRLSRLRWWHWLLLPVLACIALVAGVACFFWLEASRFDIRKLGDMPQRATVFDMDGSQYSQLRASENRVVVPVEKVSKNFLQALVAREDARFYSHPGVDPRGIARAVVRNVSRRRASEGASTLTQQLARNSLPLGGKTLSRKVLEAFVALRIEQHYTKQQILGLYVNRIYYGGGLYGIETASQAYFGKPSADLDLSESAMMAGLIRSPNRFSPLNNLKAATRERDTVLGRMQTLGMITPSQVERARSEEIKVNRNRTLIAGQENYAMEGVQNELSSLLTDEQTDEGGLKIYTTIDPKMQELATQAMEAQLAKIENSRGYEHPKKGQNPDADQSKGTDYLQGALVLIDNREGAIRALVGGREYQRGGYNRATQAERPVGSTFKPFVYTVAWQRGLLPGARVSDGPIQPGELPDAPTWAPGNSDGTFGGVLAAEAGLIRSRNTMSVRVGELVGLDAVRKLGAEAGLDDDIPASPTIYLGTFPTTLRKLTEAYTLFPNFGLHKGAYFIERVDDADGTTIYRAPHGTSRVLQPGSAWMTHAVMEKVVTQGTAAEARKLGFTKPAAGKTGTTNDFRDAWFVGYTTSLTCGVWVGLDHNETIMAKGYGAALALPVWCQVMAKAPAQRYPANAFTPPEPLKRVRVCGFSNELATDGCEAAGTAYAADLPASRLPRLVCTEHQGQILTPDGQPVLPGQTPPNGDQPRPDAFPKRFLRSFRKFFGGN